jgi:hypothetical protein
MKKENKCKDLKNKLHFMASTTLTDLVIEKNSILGN